MNAGGDRLTARIRGRAHIALTDADVEPDGYPTHEGALRLWDVVAVTPPGVELEVDLGPTRYVSLPVVQYLVEAVRAGVYVTVVGYPTTSGRYVREVQAAVDPGLTS